VPPRSRSAVSRSGEIPRGPSDRIFEATFASSNKEQNYKLEPETYTFSIGRNDRGKPAVCLDSGSGNGEACYEKRVE